VHVRMKLYLVSLLALLLSSGCGTVVACAEGGVEGEGGAHSLVYGGLRTDVKVMGSPFVPLKVMAVLDLPLSLVVDTVLFPATGVIWLCTDPEPSESGGPQRG